MSKAKTRLPHEQVPATRQTGIVVQAISPSEVGLIKLFGVLWRASSASVISLGEKVVVRDMQGLTLYVDPIKQDASVGPLASKLNQLTV